MAFFKLGASKSVSDFKLDYCVEPPAYTQVDFTHLRRGIDNVRIDVQISEVFCNIVRRISRNAVETAVDNFKGRKQWEQMARPSASQLSRFQKSYAEMMESSIHQAKHDANDALPWLARAASVAYVLQLVRSELERVAMQLKRAAKDATGTPKAVQIHAQSVWLAKYQQRLHHFLVGMFFQQMAAAESGTVGKLAQAMLNQRNSDAVRALAFNPLFRAVTPDHDELMMLQYLLLPWPGREDEAFQALDELMDNIFSHINVDAAEAVTIEGQGVDKNLRRFFADKVGVNQLSWQDNPDNIPHVFHALTVQELKIELAKLGDGRQKQILEADNPARKAFYQFVVEQLKDASVLAAVVASYSVRDAYRALGGSVPFRMVFHYLLGGKKKKEAQQRIQGMAASDTSMSPREMFARLDKAKTRDDEQTLVLRFLQDFIAYRRDVKLWAVMQSLMSQVHVLEDEDDLRLATTNKSLYVFLPPEEQQDTTSDIVGHVIIKADVRGSIGITSRLREQGLNPATHFSRTFFDPISELLPQYGAEKVFVEGDAVILNLMEYSTDQKRTAVARACGLCRKIIQIVEQQNQQHRESGLPVLELGIGIVYADEAPTFLFDGDHKITISPAIGRADRLSSCSKVVRPVLENDADYDLAQHVDVFALSEDGAALNDKGESHLRYNVNGIELDGAAFGKLKKEIGLRASNVKLPGTKMTQRYIIGQFPDALGHLHVLAIRQGIVYLWHEEKRKPLKQFYFEVIADDARYQALARVNKP